MAIVHEFIEIALVIAAILGVAGSYFRVRGRSFGVADLVIFGPLAIGADVVTYQLFNAMRGSHADSAAYGALAAMLALFGLAPVAAGLTVIALVAAVVCAVRYPAVRFGVLAVVAGAWLVHRTVGNLDDARAPGGLLNNDRLAGEHWAAESGVRSKEDCDRQSSARAFREGCYAWLGR